MLSMGAVATTAEAELASFYRKIKALEGASEDAPTMEWWKTQPEAWQEVTENAEPAELVIKDFFDWVKSFGKQPVFVAHPIGFDYAIVSWYLWKFVGDDPFIDHVAAARTLDLSSFIAGKFGLKLDDAKRNNLPRWVKTGMPEHSHKALDDARGYGVILRNVLNKKA